MRRDIEMSTPFRAPRTVPPFAVISGARVQRALEGCEKQIVELVEQTYRLPGAGDWISSMNCAGTETDRAAPARRGGADAYHF